LAYAVGIIIRFPGGTTHYFDLIKFSPLTGRLITMHET
jgi:hypothetical protein